MIHEQLEINSDSDDDHELQNEIFNENVWGPVDKNIETVSSKEPWNKR